MKKVLIFIGGMVAGAILMVVISLAIVNMRTTISDIGITMFETEGESLSENNFKIFQVLDSGDALAWEESDDFDDITVLFYRQEGKYYYDDEIINIPKGKCVRQIGIYKYTAKRGEKTVPIVRISDK